MNVGRREAANLGTCTSNNNITTAVHPILFDCCTPPKSVSLSSSNAFFVYFSKPEVTGNYIVATPRAELFIKQNRTHFKQRYRWLLSSVT